MTTTKRVMSNSGKKLNNSVLLKNFDEYGVKITIDDCVDKNIYHINYQKRFANAACPLHLIIPEFYCHVELNNGCKYLVIEQIGNNIDVLADHKEMWTEIIRRINKISKSEHVFKDEYHKFKLGSITCDDGGDDFSEIPVDELLKFAFVTISCRLVIEKDGELILETYVKEYFYEDEKEKDWEIV